MQCKWIIENYTDSEDDCRDLIEGVRALPRECYAIDKRNHFNFDPTGYVEGDCVMFQGSIQMAKCIAKRLPKNCFPISYNSWEKYLCSAYYPVFQDILFNDRHKFTTAGVLKANKFDFYREYGKEALLFVRPDSGEKTFSGQLIDLQYFDRFWDNGIVCGVKADDEVVIVSTPKQINGEWRFVCSKYGPEIITVSTYQYQGKRTLIPSAPVKATELCNLILKKGYYPDPIFCIDICEDSDGNFWLLELTSFCCAGLYATDKVKIAKRVTEIAEMEYQAQAK